MQEGIERLSGDEAFEDDFHAERLAVERQGAVHVGDADDEVTERHVGQHTAHGVPAANLAAAVPANSGRSRYVLMPGSAAQTSGMALTQWLAVTTIPGFRTSPSAIDCGCSPLNVRLTS